MTGIPKCLLMGVPIRSTTPIRVTTLDFDVTVILHFASVRTMAATGEIRFPVWKRTCDLLVSSFGLLLLSPFLGLIAVLIKIDSRGPVFFRQERVGQGLRRFSIYKFRTMVVELLNWGAPLRFMTILELHVLGESCVRAKSMRFLNLSMFSSGRNDVGGTET